MTVEQFWNRVRSCLKQKRMTQVEAAQACGIPFSTFRGWMTKGITPTLFVAHTLSVFLGVNFEYLVTGRKIDENKKINEALNLLNKAIEKLQRIRF